MAYFIALWSFVVLFFEANIGYYVNYRAVLSFTAIANITLLVMTILNRLLLGNFKLHRKLIIFDLVMLILGLLLMVYQEKFVVFILLTRQTYYILQYLIVHAFEGKLYRYLLSNPPVTLMLSFIVVIFIGTMLLMTPAASNCGTVTPFVNALFTSTSATCVTGLAVYDTGSYFSTFGQMVILMLMQVGGLGIMTISTAFALILGQRLTLKLENIMHNVVGGSYTVNLFELLKNIIVVTAIIEFLGAALLFTTFVMQMEPLKAAYFALFHAVSAFCNAGFSLFPDSFSGFLTNPLLNITITLLIILGGLGFTVIVDLWRYISSGVKIRKLTLHSKLVLASTGILLGIGFLGFLIGEYASSMKGFEIWERIWGAWFQSVTTRTAGFNTIDVSRLGSASILLTILLMFIGASPGSTGGGVKTTSFAVLVLSIGTIITGRKGISAFNRKISESNFHEAASLITFAIFIVFVIVFILLMIEPFSFEKIIFEAISAFGTVGLSMGITAELSGIGKLLITLLMYIGRIGPMTMIYAFALRKQVSTIGFAEEKLAIG